ncbi:OmpA family protein [Oscillatoria acuminata]|uniref:Outer membrane protein/peptidoglycan-associated (Lipo)protein n=1 Tax=Oscillatoria acuminata PCC 6304 TaxID=56110 RepID=K9TIY7_9CYAN|nr:OmpA family protein [Oscillatoria acuminata]AFY82126.1 outer membrane protein/peptidoglycan-associated (lipo)protein [Oscillatoria acuminata PCC 6304]
MPQPIKSLNLALASSLLLTTTACQNQQQNLPKVTIYEIAPVPVTQLERVNQTPTTTWTFKPVPLSSIDPQFLTQKRQNVETQPPETPVQIETTVEPSSATTETLPPATSVQVEQPPEPTLVTANEDPTDSTRIMVETVLPTPTEVEQTLTELNAETTIEGIKFNLSDNILFEFDKYHVRAAAKPTLEKVNQVLTHFKDARILIDGHTDSRGTDEYNIELSQKRAAAVKYYFVNNFQVQDTRIQTQGIGKSQPIAPNTNPDGSDNPQGQEKNRRVEFTIQTEARTIEIAPNSDPFGEAVKKATSAATLTQTAKTPEQWVQVAKHWQEAIAFMQVVPQNSGNYATAQQKVGEYQNNLNYARQNAGLR